MNDALIPLLDSEYIVEKFDDEILLYSEVGTHAVYLNDAAYAVWLLCREEMSVGQMIDYLKEVYPDQKEQIRRDVTSALETLRSNGMVKFAEA